MANKIIPYICVKGGAAAMEWYKQAFGATEVLRLETSDGHIAHAELSIGEASFMLSDEFSEMGVISPSTLNGTVVTLDLIVSNVDEVVKSAVDHGATLQRPVRDEFYGQRTGTILDPFGHRWIIGTVVEELTTEELKARAAKLFGGSK